MRKAYLYTKACLSCEYGAEWFRFKDSFERLNHCKIVVRRTTYDPLYAAIARKLASGEYEAVLDFPKYVPVVYRTKADFMAEIGRTIAEVGHV